MSQQSSLAVVEKYWKRWLRELPKIEDLAAAEEEKVLKLWEGLGYYSRARNLRCAAKEILDFKERNGRFPQSWKEWIQFSGVGEYTAKAVCGTVFGEACLPVDGNVYRVLSRYLGFADPLNSPEDRKAIEAFAAEVETQIQSHQREWAQVLMELGATVCRPRDLALCEACPLQQSCEAFSKKKVSLWPLKKLRAEVQCWDHVALCYRRNGDEVLLRQIPRGKRLAGQWEFPCLQLQKKKGEKTAQKLFSPHFEFRVSAKHSITNNRYDLGLVEAGSWQGSLPEAHKYLNISRTDEFPGTLTTATRKLINMLEKSKH